jgi:UDP-N-acetylglucosamine 2-epimerase
MNRKICVITGTRAEYGLLRWVIAPAHAQIDWSAGYAIENTEL